MTKKFQGLWPTNDHVVLLKEVLAVLKLVDEKLTVPAQGQEATVNMMVYKLDTVFHVLNTEMAGNSFGQRVSKFLKTRIHNIITSNAGWQINLYLHPQSRTFLTMIAGGETSSLLTCDDAKKILAEAPRNCMLLGQRLHRIALKSNNSPEEAAEEEAEIQAAAAAAAVNLDDSAATVNLDDSTADNSVNTDSTEAPTGNNDI